MNQKAIVPGQILTIKPTSLQSDKVIATISFTSLINALMTTTLDGSITYAQAVLRILAVLTILTDFLVITWAFTTGFRLIKRPVKTINVNSLVLLATIVMVIPVFSQSSSMLFSAFITARYLLQITTVFALIHIIEECDAFDAKRYLRMMLSDGLSYIAYITLIALVIPNPSTFPWTGGLPSATNIRHIGNYVAIFLIAFIALYLWAKERSRWAYLFAVFVMTAFLRWTGSRAAFVGIAIALLVSFAMLNRHITMKRIAILVATLGLAVVATIPLPTLDPVFGVVRMINSSNTLRSEDISSARLQV